MAAELPVEVLPDAPAVTDRVVDVIVEAIGRAIMRRGRAVIALSGGRTPKPMYSRLAAASLDWSRVHVLQVDERFAPDGDPARNWEAIRRDLVEPTGANGHPMPTGGSVEEAQATAYAALVDHVAEGTIDLVHLGLGDDGHTASLVPGDAALDATDPVVLTGEYQGHRRMTMTAPLLNAATTIVIEVVGEAKRTAVQRLLAGDTGIPAHLIRREGDVRLVVDRAAASAPAPVPAPQPTSRLLVVKATHGPDDPERANLACNVAAVGVAAGAEVHLFLAADGVRLALPDVGADMALPEAAPIEDLLDVVYAGGRVIVCTPCATRRGLSQADLREGTLLGGSAGFVELALRPDSTTLVY